ncbi:hypothetical protein HDU83_000976 [Entophlyctis luteolus]|nr:hypothetical protein HDU83_000976 [Entophlyctis luteolus]
MPLIIMVGLPSSGKTRRAMEIATALEAEISSSTTPLRVPFDPKVLVINEESLGIDRATAFRDSSSEKIARAALLSAVERSLTRDKFVILDSMNYIKGFRYQLHCVAKGIATTQHTVYCMASPANCEKWNASREPANIRYPNDVLESLFGRLEEPDSRNRWDSPLLCLAPDATLPPSFVHSLVQANTGGAGTLAATNGAVAAGLAPSQSIALKPVADTNYLHEMDATLKAICDAVLDAVRRRDTIGGGGVVGGVGGADADEVSVPGSGSKVVLPSRNVSVTEMGRLRRLYAANLNRLTIKVDKTKIADGFVEFVNQNLR